MRKNNPIIFKMLLFISALLLLSCTTKHNSDDPQGDTGDNSNHTISSKMALWTSSDTLLRGANLINGRTTDDNDRIIHDGSLEAEYTLEDLKKMAWEGSNYANISFPGIYHEKPTFKLDSVVLARYDTLLKRLKEADLFAVIAFRSGPGRSGSTFYRDEDLPDGELNESIWSSQSAQKAWVAMWKYTAEHFKDNPIIVGYDIMVEPNSNEVAEENHPNDDLWNPLVFRRILGGTTWDWNQLYPQIVNAIREHDADTPILIAGNAYSPGSWLSDLQILSDAKIVYIVHQYEPIDYTHQAASDNIKLSDADGSNLDQIFQDIDNFMSQHKVAVGVNEFGVVRFAPGAAAFIENHLTRLEARGINHAIWAWAPSIGYFGSTDFHLYYGPLPNNTSHMDPNDLLQVVRQNWQKNQHRPSNTNFQ